MDTLKEVIDSLRMAMKDRLANPLYFGYVIAWSVINFRLLLVLVGDGTWSDKIRYIDTTLYPRGSDWAWQGGIVPLIVAVIYIFASPFVNRWVTVFLRTREKKTLDQLLRVAGETPLSEEAANRLRKFLLDEKQGRKDESRASQARLDELTAQLELLQEENATLKKSAVTHESFADRQAQAQDAIQQTQKQFQLDLGRNLGDLEKVIRFKRSDFPNEDLGTYGPHVADGLTRAEFALLFLLKDGDALAISDFMTKLGVVEGSVVRFPAQSLVALKLIEEKSPEVFQITPLGRTALFAAISRPV